MIPAHHGPATARTRALSAAAGALLCFMFLGLSETAQGLRVSFAGEGSRSSAGEVLLWLGVALLLMPGGALLGFAGAGVLGAPLRRLWAPPRDARAQRWIALLLYLGSVLLAGLCHQGVLRGLPITDDEYAARFGGQVLALGRLTVPLPLPLDATPNRFFWIQGVEGTSMDWIGCQLAWAAGEVTGLKGWVFALFAGLPAPALYLLLARRLRPGYGLLAALLSLLSPMMFSLSMTTHAHVLSRGLLALGLWLYDPEDGAPPRVARTLLAGLALGLAFLCRPVEIAALCAPLLLSEARIEERRRHLGLALLTAIPTALLLFAPALLLSGTTLPLRFQPESSVDLYPSGSLWHRFGAGVSYNLFMLLVWLLGPLTLPLCGLGVFADRFTRALGAGVALVLGVALLHDTTSIHVVGPIHYSECAVPLLVLALYGLRRLREAAALPAPALVPAAGALAGALLLGLGGFSIANARALRGQATLQHDLYRAVEGAVRAQVPSGKVVVLAPRFHELWGAHPAGRNGSKVFDWRRPRPDYSDPILILHDVSGWERLRERFGDRRFVRLQLAKQPPLLRVAPIP